MLSRATGSLKNARVMTSWNPERYIASLPHTPYPVPPSRNPQREACFYGAQVAVKELRVIPNRLYTIPTLNQKIFISGQPHGRRDQHHICFGYFDELELREIAFEFFSMIFFPVHWQLMQF
jgi:hypothetical protein